MVSGLLGMAPRALGDPLALRPLARRPIARPPGGHQPDPDADGGARPLRRAETWQVENPSFMSGGIQVLSNVVLPWNRIVIIVFAVTILLSAMWVLLFAHAGPWPVHPRGWDAEPRGWPPASGGAHRPRSTPGRSGWGSGHRRTGRLRRLVADRQCRSRPRPRPTSSDLFHGGSSSAAWASSRGTVVPPRWCSGFANQAARGPGSGRGDRQDRRSGVHHLLHIQRRARRGLVRASKGRAVES